MSESDMESPHGHEEGPPPALGRVPDERVLDVDVRDDLRNGREPFSRIMEARERMPEGGILRVRAIFEPAPLYRVMARQGLSHWSEQLAADDWRVWFYDPSRLEAGAEEGSPAGDREPEEGGEATDVDDESVEDPDDDVVVLDVRGLEPPEPLVRTLEALDALPESSTLVQINAREPVFLYPRLEERGATWEVRRQEEGVVRVFIRKAPG